MFIVPDAAVAAAVGMSGGVLAAAKKQLRHQMKQRLAALPSASVDQQSSAIFSALAAFPPYRHARRVAVFLSMPAAEVQTDAIVRHALAAGKQVFVPYLHKPGSHLAATGLQQPPPARVMDMVRLHDCADYESLLPDRWGIPSVSPASVPNRSRILGDGDGDAPVAARALDLDLILMPGVAFDVDPASGRIRRCGHGRGFYDYFLHRYASAVSPAVHLCGLALSEQILPNHADKAVPTGPHDKPLDSLITGAGTIVTSLG
ncbi:5-formyltetrahydrofolate cyclo-ligase [Grosmannia clavigera kw1407]|uniref:5-formyltetrahydrofolate cyclo-ligase n=1 Tax=Grosmannia clavigera (strain kw1407 / UAMH 11150) TaxID=655863 RepID=F0X964_GROCL|nr:5-formyltetrahydrofolate cyclo-ligase [Grosmannia clavigera kw1407]EFX05663.1 5-formyltetrahydrofolate cyclo-ligase [Grosmannia clavigera kw1407]